MSGTPPSAGGLAALFGRFAPLIKRHGVVWICTSQPLNHILIAGGRIGLGAAVAVMQGGHLHVTMHRAVQRMAGTIAGAFVVWAILAVGPPFWAIVALIIVFQFITEIIIGYNYALGQITITPMALLMTYLASPATTTAEMSIERVFDTMLGAVLGIVFAVISSTMDDRLHLAKYHRERRAGRSREA